MRSANGLIIGAPRSGSGKTLVTLGLLAALRERGLSVAPAKTGPDYIDTAILGRVAGTPAINLDPWAMRQLFAARTAVRPRCRRRSAAGRGRDGPVRRRRRRQGLDRRSGGHAEAAGRPGRRRRKAGPVDRRPGLRLRPLPRRRRSRRRHRQPRRHDAARKHAALSAAAARHPHPRRPAAARRPGPSRTAPRTGATGRNLGLRRHRRQRPPR